MDFIEVGSLNAVKSDKEFRQINRLKKRERDKNKKRKKEKKKEKEKRKRKRKRNLEKRKKKTCDAANNEI